MMAALLTGELPFYPLSTQYISPAVDTYTVSILQQKPISTAGRTWIYFTPSAIFSKHIVCLKSIICTEEQQKLKFCFASTTYGTAYENTVPTVGKT